MLPSSTLWDVCRAGDMAATMPLNPSRLMGPEEAGAVVVPGPPSAGVPSPPPAAPEPAAAPAAADSAAALAAAAAIMAERVEEVLGPGGAESFSLLGMRRGRGRVFHRLTAVLVPAAHEVGAKLKVHGSLSEAGGQCGKQRG